MTKVIQVIEGKPKIEDIDASFYTESHDIPMLWIGKQIIDVGNGYGSWPSDKDEQHLRWKLDPNKTYRVTIEEVKDD